MTAWVDFFGIGVQGFVEKRFVTPAKAGVQNIKINKIYLILWIPAYAGMTDSEFFMLFNKSLGGSAKSTANCSLIFTHLFLFHSTLAFLNRII